MNTRFPFLRRPYIVLGALMPGAQPTPGHAPVVAKRAWRILVETEDGRVISVPCRSAAHANRVILAGRELTFSEKVARVKVPDNATLEELTQAISGLNLALLFGNDVLPDWAKPFLATRTATRCAIIAIATKMENDNA